MENKYVLYILMNNDLTSMNSGKAIAQGSHASVSFAKYMSKEATYKDWCSEGYGPYGTTVVLKSNKKQIYNFLACQTLFVNCAYVIDKTYPFLVDKELASLIDENILTSEPTIKGDNVLLTRSQMTCAYFFVKSNSPTREMFNGLELY